MNTPRDSIDVSRINARIQEGCRLYAKSARHIIRMRALWVAITLLVVLILVDAALGLPSVMRLLLLVIALGIWIARQYIDHRAVMKGSALELQIAQQLEQQIPNAHDALSNAMDFRRKVEQVDDIPRKHMMASEIHRAAEVASGLRPGEQPTPGDRRRIEKVRLLTAAGTLVVLSLIAPRLVSTVAKRYLNPLSDSPPYSLTQFYVAPGNTAVKYGESLNVSIKVKGPKPGQLILNVEDAGSGERVELPLYASAAGVYEQQLEHLTHDTRYRVTGKRARSPWYTVSVERTPVIETRQATFEYPEYTRLRKETRFIGPDGISAFAGTRVTVHLSANQPVQGGVLTHPEGEAAFVPDRDPQTVAAAFIVVQSGEISAVVHSAGGHNSRPWKSTVNIRNDRAPEIVMLEPSRESMATPGARVPLVIEARDDLGVAAVALFRSHNSSRDHRRIMHADPASRIMVRVSDVLDLRDLGVRAGDSIQLYASATDSNPDTPRTAASPIHTLQIISEEDYQMLRRQEMTATELREQYQEWLNSMEQLLKAATELQEEVKRLKDSPADADDAGRRQKVEDIRQQAEKLSQSAREQAKALKEESRTGSVFDVEKSYKKLLESASDSVSSAAGDLQEAASCAGGGSPGGLDDAEEALQRVIEALGGQSAEDMARIDAANEEIEMIAPLFENVERYKELLMRQEILVRHAAYYRDKKELSFEDSIRLKELSEEQEHLREDLSDIVRTFLEEAPNVEENYPKVAGDARDLAEAIDRLDIDGLMTKASTELNNRKPVPGHAHAADALDALNSLVQNMKRGQGEAGGQCEVRLRIEMDMELGNTLGQLSQRIGMGVSGIGGMGRGRAGYGSISKAMNVYGDSASRNIAKRSSVGGGNEVSPLGDVQDERESLSGDIEVIELNKDDKITVHLPEGEPVMEEYRDIVKEYFKRMAEQ